MNSTILLAKINSLASNIGPELQEQLKDKVSKDELNKELAKKANASSLTGKADKVHTHNMRDIEGLGAPVTSEEIDAIITSALNK